MKTCTDCGLTKDYDYFPWRSERLMYNSKCRDCVNRIARARLKKNPFPHRASNKRFMERNPARWAEITKKCREKNKEKIKKRHKAIIEKAPHKYKARKKLNHKVELGKIKNPNICAADNCHCSKQIEAHHLDYSKPLDVVWLCSKHHKAWHRVFIPEG